MNKYFIYPKDTVALIKVTTTFDVYVQFAVQGIFAGSLESAN